MIRGVGSHIMNSLASVRKWIALCTAATLWLASIFIVFCCVASVVLGPGRLGWEGTIFIGLFGSIIGIGIFFVSRWCLFHYSMACVKTLAVMVVIVLFAVLSNLLMPAEAPEDYGACVVQMVRFAFTIVLCVLVYRGVVWSYSSDFKAANMRLQLDLADARPLTRRVKL
jgi:hypothetical protein